MEVIKKVPKFDEIVTHQNDDMLHVSFFNESFSQTGLSYSLLPPRLELELIKNTSPNCIQFMFLASSPEQESIFQQMKEKFGSLYLWHGSGIDKWHSIIRN